MVMLTANVSHFETGRMQCPIASNIHITDVTSGKVIAVARLGGKFSDHQALNEFQRLPGRFNKAPKPEIIL